MKINIFYINIFLIFTLTASLDNRDKNLALNEIKENIEEVLNIKTKDKNIYNKPVRIGVLDVGNSQFIHDNYKVRKTSSIIPIKNNNHGDHVAGIILALSSFSEITSLQYFDKSSLIFNLYIALKEQSFDIINFSSSGPFPIKEEKHLLNQLGKKGVIVVVASGNDGLNTDVKKAYPASYLLENVISVANISETDKNVFTNYGKDITIGITGDNILSFSKNKLVKKSGSSQSTAIVTSVIAKIKSKYPNISINEIKNILKINSIPSPYTALGILDYNQFNHWINQNLSYEEFKDES